MAEVEINSWFVYAVIALGSYGWDAVVVAVVSVIWGGG